MRDRRHTLFFDLPDPDGGGEIGRWIVHHECPEIRRVDKLACESVLLGYDCGVSHEVDSVGIEGDWPPGLHFIESWSEQIVGPTWTEIDAGLRCTEDCPHPSHRETT